MPGARPLYTTVSASPAPLCASSPGAATTTTVMPWAGGWQVDRRGDVTAFRWDATTSLEEVVRLDVSTGEATAIGTVGDLLWWSGQTLIDPVHDVIYVQGTPEGPMAGLDGVEQTYSIDVVTGDRGLSMKLRRTQEP